jgi:cell wall-associated NlpC family hydrolase
MEFYAVNQTTIGLNSPDFYDLFGKKEFLSSKGHPLAYEMVLFEGMVGKLLEKLDEKKTVKLLFPFYPKPLYVFSKHVQQVNHSTQNFSKKLNSDQMIIRLLKCLGKPYLWGGNLDSCLVQPLVENAKEFCVRKKRAILLDGIDCSGLLFFASGFITPRNTAELQSFGKPVRKDDLLKPLDLILTLGHVAIVINSHQVIQSRQNRGVYLSRLDVELKMLNRKKIRVQEVKYQEEFSIRRFIL